MITTYRCPRCSLRLHTWSQAPDSCWACGEPLEVLRLAYERAEGAETRPGNWVSPRRPSARYKHERSIGLNDREDKR